MRLKRQKGITLVEVILSLLILVVLVSISVPNLVNMAESSESVTFQANLKDIENAIKIVAESNNYNATKNIVIKEPYYYIELNGAGDNSAKTIGPSVITRVDGKGTENPIDDIILDRVFIPTSLEIALEKEFGRHAKLKAYAINMEQLRKSSDVPVDPLYPKVKIEGLNETLLQTKAINNVSLKKMFAGDIKNYNSSSSVYNEDKEDTIPNDTVVERPGYYFLIDAGDTIKLFYSGTEAIAYDKYIHMP